MVQFIDGCMLALELERESFDGSLAKCQIHQYFPRQYNLLCCVVLLSMCEDNDCILKDISVAIVA